MILRWLKARLGIADRQEPVTERRPSAILEHAARQKREDDAEIRRLHHELDVAQMDRLRNR